MKKITIARKEETTAPKKNLDGGDRTDSMSIPVFRKWGFNLFKGI